MEPTSPELMAQVERAILAFERDGDTGLQAVLAESGPLTDDVRTNVEALRSAGLLHPPELPDRIGTWRVKRRLGSGGMGTVFLGVQDQPIARQGAIKVIRAGMDTHEVLARFAIERQALALLDHPGIARILDAGRTETGRPFLVMEFVPGEPICRYCDERQLDTAARLRLFARVCDAVQHAHQKGLLHRDLKPSNILVADRDGEPWPVVIDFGVAKSVGAPIGRATLTMPGRLLGTPEYMSPEQAANLDDVDTRSDVYSLGVVLYELLTSKLPIEGTQLRLAGIDRALREHEPPTPSTRITTLGDAAATVAAQRRTSVPALRKRLRGDLDWIVMQAIDRDRNRRYAMPAELAADVRRHLAHEPVTAGAPTTWYRLSKYCARHRLQVVAAGMVLGSLVAGLAASITFWRDAQAHATRSTASHLASLQAVGELVQVGDVELVAVPHLERVRADMLSRATRIYQGFLDDAGADDPSLVPRTLDVLVRLASMQQQLGRIGEAETNAQQVLALLTTTSAHELPVAARNHLQRSALTILANLHDRRSRTADALAAIDAALAIPAADPADAAGDERDLRLRIRLLSLRSDQRATSDVPAALHDAEAAEALFDTLARRHPKASGLLALRLGLGGDVANLLRLAGRPQDALRKVTELNELRRTHPERTEWPSARATLHLVGVLDSAERHGEVLHLCDELEPTLQRFVDDHPSIVVHRSAMLELQNHRANAFLQQKDLSSALAVMRRMRDGAVATLELAPEEIGIQRQLVTACINLVVVQNESLRIGREPDLDEMADALRLGRQTLDALPTEVARAAARAQRVELLRLQSVVDDARRDGAAALVSLREAVAIGRELLAESFGGAEFQNRNLELQRMFVAKLLDAGLAVEAAPVVAGALADSLALREKTAAMARWHSRHRELLLLAMRTHGALGDRPTASAHLDEHLRMGPEPPGGALDWIGRQEAGTALAKLLPHLPADAADRDHWLQRGRDLLDEGLGYAQANLDAGNGHAMVAVMSGNTWAIRRDLERAAGRWPEAARAAGEALEQYAEAQADNPSDRGERRLVATAASQFQCLARAGDANGLELAAARASRALADRGMALAELATAMLTASTPAVAEPSRTLAVSLLQAARAAGCTAAELAAARFDPLRAEPMLRDHLR
jgi:serine/threonine protein kinase/tetratricopeptide (TPR) repeat protein